MCEAMPNTYSMKTISKMLVYAVLCMVAFLASMHFSGTAYAADGSWVNSDEVMYQGKSFQFNSSQSTDHNKLWLDCTGTGTDQHTRYRMMQITSSDKTKATVYIANPLYNSKICDYQWDYTPVEISLDITNLSKAPTSTKPKAYFEGTYNRITYEGRFYWNLAGGSSNVFYHVLPFSAQCPTDKIILTNGLNAQFQHYSPSAVGGNACNAERVVEIEMTTTRPPTTASIGHAYYQDSRRYLNFNGDIYTDGPDGKGRVYTFKPLDSAGKSINGCTATITPNTPKDINDAVFKPCIHTENGYTQLGQIDINLKDFTNAANTYYQWSGDAIVESGNPSVVFKKQATGDIYVKNEDGDCKDYFDSFNSDKTEAKLHVMKKEFNTCKPDGVSTQKIAGNQNAIICSDKQHPPNGEINPALWCQNNSTACDNGTTIGLADVKKATLSQKQEWCKQHGSDYSGVVGTDVSVVPEGKSPCVVFSGSCETECKDDGSGSCIYKYINLALTFLSTGVGVVIVIMIIVGGIQYATSSGDPSAIGAAKGRIANALIALIAFILMYAVLQWLIPGGAF